MDSPPPSRAPEAIDGSTAWFPRLGEFLRGQELAHIRRAIECCGGDKRKAAALLHVSLATLYRKLESPPQES